MRSFSEIFEIAAERHGGVDPLNAKLKNSISAGQAEISGDDRWLAAMTQCIFQAGFSWKVVEAMWPGFEKAFHGFDIGKCAMMDDAWFDRLVTDTTIVRHGPKIHAVQQNAVFLQELAVEAGHPAGRVFANWPSEDFAGLLALIKQRGNRLGGATGMYVLRRMNVDGYVLSRDVTARLIAEGVIDKPAGSKSSMAAVQNAFNTWHQASGQSLTTIA